MKKKIRVGVLCGGRSAEHEVSLQSAQNVIEAIDREKYEVVLIGIDHAGAWHLQDVRQFLLNANNPEQIRLRNAEGDIAVIPEKQTGMFMALSEQQHIGQIDVLFPLLHGPYGEDGTVQGLLKLADIPFVGAGVLGSAVGMDKDVMKRLLRAAGIPTADFLSFPRSARRDLKFQSVADTLGLPCFVKPANLGSSIGINRVSNKAEFEEAIEEAFQFDRKIIIEQAIEGREIECSVLGNDTPIASVPGEIITDPSKHQFYSYRAKYIDETGAELRIPADLSEGLAHRIQVLSIAAFKTLCCEGMARVDCFLTHDAQVFINEINTIPGFTRISMYPKLWEASGMPYSELIDRLIQLAIERHEEEKCLRSSYF